MAAGAGPTTRQSLEQALEEYGVQSEGPSPGLGLQQLARSSRRDEVRLGMCAECQAPHARSLRCSTAVAPGCLPG